MDRIAARAELTRGAVYSNFRSKRALYLAVLLDAVGRAEPERDEPVPVPRSAGEALTRFARVWLDRLPLSGDADPDGRLRLRSLTGVLDDDPGRDAFAQVLRVEALLLALALENLPDGAGRRRVRVADVALTLLRGASHLAETAPGAVEPFDLARACGHLSELDLADAWDPAHLPFVPAARSTDEPWTPPSRVRDHLTGSAVDLSVDGVVVVLGAARLAVVEEAVRALPRGRAVTVLVTTGDPDEIGRLLHLRLVDVADCLRRALAVAPAFRVVIDDHVAVAAVRDGRDADRHSETAVRIVGGRIVARADGRGAGHAVASAVEPVERLPETALVPGPVDPEG